MARFDWRKFCIRYDIRFVTEGANTAKGNISIHCPFCGSADGSEHMGLKLDPADPVWGCFRNAAHGGRNPAYLVAKLLNLSHKAAENIVAMAGAAPVDEFEGVIERLRNAPETAPETPQLGAGPPVGVTMPQIFRPLSGGHYAERFYDYLAKRGFDGDEQLVADTYQLHYCLIDRYAWRLIFPIFAEHGFDHYLAGWTGRDIRHGAKVRYLAMEGLGKDVLYQPSPLASSNTLVVCEGPMDALKLDFYGGLNVTAVALMGTAWTTGQLLELVRLQKIARRVCIVLDRDAYIASVALVNALQAHATCPIRTHQLPGSYKDPGELPRNVAYEFCQTICLDD